MGEGSATWTVSPSNATNATSTIYNRSPSANDALGTVVVDQTKATVGTVNGHSHFQELGDYFSASNVTVVLNASTANGSLVADAVGIAPGWAGGGGPSEYEAEPSYQLSSQSTGFRMTPDVSFNASENTGVVCYQDGRAGYHRGTTPACPSWAGLFAIANQGRVADGGAAFSGVANPMEAVHALYSLPSGDDHDITSGYNGDSAGPGYDQVTGLGSPIDNLLVPQLVSDQMPGHLVVTAQPTDVTAGGRVRGDRHR